jgi:hypothetical protein
MEIEREDATLPAATLIVLVAFVFIFANIFLFFLPLFAFIYL